MISISISFVMFNSVCKTLLLHYGRRCTITSTSYNKEFSFTIFMKCLSTATSNQHSFTVSYLINSCGFSLKTALSASKRVNFNSPEKPESVVALLKSYGFSETQISMLIRRCPKLLGASPERTLVPKFEFFYSKGFSSPELVKILSVCPGILFRSLENHIIPTFNYLIDLFKPSEKVVDAVKCSPYVLNQDIETHIAPSIDVLIDIGVPERNIINFLSFWSRPSKTSLSTFKNTVEAVKEMGFNPLNSQFILAVIAKGRGRINWESKVEIYRRWGWSEEEFLAAFRKNPLCMLSSHDKIIKVMDFLVNKMDMESSAIAKCPHIIVFSMEKRFIPRGAVFHFLLSKGLIEREKTYLYNFFHYPEKVFLQKFVNSYEEAPQLLKLYREKLGISKLIKTSVSREMDAEIVSMLLEMYTNCAGFFTVLEESIESTVDESGMKNRENGEMLEMKVARAGEKPPIKHANLVPLLISEKLVASTVLFSCPDLQTMPDC